MRAAELVGEEVLVAVGQQDGLWASMQGTASDWLNRLASIEHKWPYTSAHQAQKSCKVKFTELCAVWRST